MGRLTGFEPNAYGTRFESVKNIESGNAAPQLPLLLLLANSTAPLSLDPLRSVVPVILRATAG